MQPVQSDTSSECALHRASPSLLALHEKYGQRQPLSSMSPAPSLKGMYTHTESTTPYLHSKYVSPSVNSAHKLRQSDKRTNSDMEASGSKRPRRDSSLTRSRFKQSSDTKRPDTVPGVSSRANSRENTSLGVPGSRNLLRTLFRSVHISEEDYNSLPEYLRTVARGEIQNALDKIVDLFEKGQSSVTAEDAVSLGIREAQSTLHCLAILKILSTGFSHGNTVYEPGKRLEL